MRPDHQATTRTRVVPEFIPDEILRDDTGYLSLIRNLTERQVRYAHARCVYPGRMNASKCLRMVAPDLSKESAAAMATKSHDLGGQYESHPGVRDLIAYLQPLWREYLAEHAPVDAEPLTLDEILRRWEAQFRATDDPAVALQLGERIIKFRGLERDRTQDDRIKGVEIPQEFIDSLPNGPGDSDEYLNDEEPVT